MILTNGNFLKSTVGTRNNQSIDFSFNWSVNSRYFEQVAWEDHTFAKLFFDWIEFDSKFLYYFLLIFPQNNYNDMIEIVINKKLSAFDKWRQTALCSKMWLLCFLFCYLISLVSESLFNLVLVKPSTKILL